MIVRRLDPRFFLLLSGSYWRPSVPFVVVVVDVGQGKGRPRSFSLNCFCPLVLLFPSVRPSIEVPVRFFSMAVVPKRGDGAIHLFSSEEKLAC